jgi:dienelactone hydrolase
VGPIHAIRLSLALLGQAPSPRAPDTVVVPNGPLRLHALLWRPPPDGDGPFPAVLFNHGSGNTVERQLAQAAAMGPVFARHGYVCLFLFRRGSALSADQGVSAAARMDSALAAGGQAARNRLQIQLLETDHLSDALAGLAFLRSLPAVDPHRVVVAGHSFGASLTLLIAERDSALRAAILFSGSAASWDDSPPLRARLLAAASRTTVPIFFIQAENDYSIAPARELSAAMARLGKPHRVKIYPPVGTTAVEGHDFPYRRIDAWEPDVFDFLEDPVPFTLTRLALDLRVDYARGAIDGSATLRFRNVAPRPAAEVPLLLNRLMSIARVTDTAGVAVPFTQRVAVFQDDSMRQVDAATVTLGRAVLPGDSVTIVVHYGGRLVGYTETGSLYVRDHVSRDFTVIREDALAFPSLGAPSWRANRAIVREPFAFTARVSVPADLTVAMGGRLVGSTRQDSIATWTYASEPGGPVPFLNIAIAPYQVIDDGGSHIFYFPQDSTGARMVRQALTGAMSRYTAWYGPLGRSPRVTVMEIPEGWGSQASLTAGIIETADAFRDRAQLHQLYHELSHIWNPPDLDRPSPRWNEGLASFLEWRMAAELDGWNGWDARLDRLEQSLRGRCASGGPCATVPPAGYGAAEATGLSYQVGAIMFYALHRTMGAERFDRAYREFYQAHRQGGATGADLVAAFRRADPRATPILADWYSTTRWYARLTAGESVRQIVEGYAR